MQEALFKKKEKLSAPWFLVPHQAAVCIFSPSSTESDGLSSSFLEPIFFPRKDFISSRNLIIAILGKKEKDNVDL